MMTLYGRIGEDATFIVMNGMPNERFPGRDVHFLASSTRRKGNHPGNHSKVKKKSLLLLPNEPDANEHCRIT